MEEEIVIHETYKEDLQEIKETLREINSQQQIDIEEILNKYFNTLEEQKEEKETLNYESQDFQTQLINEIKVLQEYQQYNNNLLYFQIVAIGVILVSTLMYKFLKIFY